MTFREYAVKAIETRLAKMLSQADAVRSAEDIEAVHDMRVASRRLRAALSVFASAFPNREFKRFDKDVKTVTDALGRARDLDVMIDTISDLAKTLPLEEREEVDSLAKKLQRERDKLQKDVIIDLELADRTDLPGRFRAIAGNWDMTSSSSESAADSSPNQDNNEFTDSDGSIHAQFAIMIPARLAELVAWEPCLSHYGRVRELHQMRIAAKRLRYTMELLAPFEPSDFGEMISKMKLVQELLGNIHDADVLVPCLWHHLAQHVRDRKEISELDGVHFTDFQALMGLLRLCDRRRIERDQLFDQFRKTWTGLRSSGYFDALWTAANQRIETPDCNTHLEQTHEEIRTTDKQDLNNAPGRRTSRPRNRAHPVAAKSGIRDDRVAAGSERGTTGGGTGHNADQGKTDLAAVERNDA